MIDPWFDMAMMAIEAQQVVSLRLIKLAQGGPAAGREAGHMVSEKVDAAVDAAKTLLTGGTPAAVIGSYRAAVSANAARLSRD